MGKVEKREITGELQESYLDYAMSVIVSRALPDVRDGLKPVHRRILWDMWDSGLGHLAKFRKSANVIGQVLARYHPHGDVAVYDALVRMAQDFSLRYPLVQGQGNFGSIDGDSPAAYRYTESRLSKIAEETLSDIEKETVDWQPNYDATRLEPKVLPAKLPNLLLNGSMGIAVGMATNIPSHNVGEVADAVLFLADHPDASAEELAQFLKGPDFPTGGLIFDRQAIKEVYLTGRGTIVTRARVEVVERKSKQFDLVISEVPYQVNKAELVKKIAELVQDKKVEGIRDLRDESDRNGLRVVVELKNDASPQKVLNQLYRHTDLQKDFHANMIALMDGLEPRLLSVREILAAYFEHRKSVVRRRTQFDLARAKERAHVLEGLVKALEQIDQVIATIKKSKDREEAHRNLVSRFNLTDIQATAILEMKLQTLAALEREKIEDELKEKRALMKDWEAILKSPAKIVKIIKEEVSELKAKYGGPRRTEVVAGPLGEFREEDLVPEEEVVITLSASGYVKRLPPDTFTSQRRGGKGLIGSEVSEADFLTHFVRAQTHDHILFFTNRGRVFGARVYEIPQASRTSKGRAIHNFLELPADEEVRAVLSYREDKESGKYLIMGTASGLIKKTPLKDFANIRRTGIIAVSLKKGDALRWVRLSGGNDEVILATVQGQAIRFSERQIRAMSRTAAGIRAIRLKQGDAVAGFDIIKGGETDIANQKLLVVMANGFGKQTPLPEYKRQNRGGSGIKTANLTEKTGKLVTALIVSTETEILALSQKGQVIRTQLRSVRQTSRAAQGVRLMRLKSGDRLAGVVII